MGWFDSILMPLMVAVGWTMVQFHRLFTEVFGLAADSGASWVLSIVGLVILMRIILIPLFFKQIKASRGMQMLSPELQAIQKRYKGKTDPASREAMGRETMELYRKHGTNPFSSCLPILAQSPIFFALFRVLYSLPQMATGTYPSAENPRSSIGLITPEVAGQINDATLFGAKISSHFLAVDATVETRIVTALLIVAMSATTFFTQRQLTRKNMPPSALQGPMAQQQKILLYALPLIFAFTGVNFPIGVLVYWTTTNLWSMGQQFYTIRRMPMPGSEAETAFKARQAKKAARRGLLGRGTPVIEEPEPEPEIEEQPKSGQRQQPKRKDRQKKPASPGGTSGPGGTSKPGGSSKPGGTSKPGGSSKPGGASKPGGSSKPGGTGTPGGTSKPGGPGGAGKPKGPKKPGSPGGSQGPSGPDKKS